jgi:hypothetical protein
VTALLSPSNNAQGQDNPLTVAVALDSQDPIIHQPMPDSAAGKQPAAWDGVDGFAANNIIPVVTKFTGVSAGKHTFKVQITHLFRPIIHLLSNENRS